MADTRAKPGNGADGQLADLADLLVNVAREIREYGPGREGRTPLTMRESSLMRCIDKHPGLTGSDAAAATGLLQTNLSATLRSLRHKGLVDVRRDQADQRVIHLYPTAEAEENLAILRRRWAEQLGAVLGAEDPDLGACLAVLRRLEAGLTSARRSSAEASQPIQH